MRLVSLIICITIISIGPGLATAQPEIQNLDGSFVHGGSVTILGSSFGIKNPAPPLRYENFEDGIIGSNIKTQENGGYYTFDNSDSPTYSQDRQRIPGEICALQDYSTFANQTIGLRQMDVDTLYVSGWTYRDDFDGTALFSENVKFWGNFSNLTDSGNYSYPQCRFDAYWAANSGHLYSTLESGYSGVQDGCGPHSHTDEWFRLERYIEIGDPGVENGMSWAAYNGSQIASISGLFHTTTDTYQYFLIGQYFRKEPYDNPDLPEASIKVYWGELYADNTLARIEIGNNSEFALCTHREIQIPLTWDSNQVSFTVNQGTFLAEENLFLFVIDRDGIPSTGEPIVIDSDVTFDAPGPPGQPNF